MAKSKLSDDPKAIHFQIQFVKDGGGSYYYFSTLPKEDIGEKAANVATEDYLVRGRENDLFGTFRPIKTATVVQYDRVKGAPVRGGIKFKVRLSFVQATYSSGKKVRNEFYVADEIEQKKKATA